MVDVLRNRDVDAAFVMCAELVCHTPADCASYLAEIPMVCLDIAPCLTTVASDVVLLGVIDAMESAGRVLWIRPSAKRCFAGSTFRTVHL